MRPVSRWKSVATRRLVPHSLRRRLRAPSWRWALTAALSIGTGLFAYGALVAVADGAERYGSVQPVVVAARDLPAGVVLTDDDVRHRELPASALPDDPLRSDPTGRALRTAAYAGQALSSAQIAGEKTSGLTAGLTDGARAVALPRGDAPIELHPGDHVDVLAIDPGLGTAEVVAAGVEVLGVDEVTATVAVDEADLTEVATAIVGATTVLALSPG